MNAKRTRMALYVVRRFKTGSHELISEDAPTLLTPELAMELRETLHREKNESQYAVLEVASLETTSGTRWNKQQVSTYADRSNGCPLSFRKQWADLLMFLALYMAISALTSSSRTANPSSGRRATPTATPIR